MLPVRTYSDVPYVFFSFTRVNRDWVLEVVDRLMVIVCAAGPAFIGASSDYCCVGAIIAA